VLAKYGRIEFYARIPHVAHEAARSLLAINDELAMDLLPRPIRHVVLLFQPVDMRDAIMKTTAEEHDARVCVDEILKNRVWPKGGSCVRTLPGAIRKYSDNMPEIEGVLSRSKRPSRRNAALAVGITSVPASPMTSCMAVSTMRGASPRYARPANDAET
jgi:hypothetical protein